MLGNSLGWGLYFLFYGRAKEALQKRKAHGEHLGSAEFFGASIFAGKFSALYGQLIAAANRQ
jgi:primary-amine oxidase